MKEKIAVLLNEAISEKDLPKEKIQSMIEVPPDSRLGDYAFPCHLLAGKWKKNPNEIAQKLSGKILAPELIEKASAVGPYLNFRLNYSRIASRLLPKILKEKEKFGQNREGKKSKVMVEYSAPNTNKPLHLGHLRNDSIGMALSNLFEANGVSVVRANLYSNRGIHISKSMLAYLLWGKGKKPKGKPDHFVGDFYVKFNEKSKEDPSLEIQAQRLLALWEKGDKKTLALWKKMDSWAIKGFRETYKRFGSRFDVEFRESDFYGKSEPIIREALKKKVFNKTSSGAIVADLEKEGLGKKVVVREDGTSIYITNDLALTLEKFKRFKLNKAVWVVGSEQKFYFKQLFKIFDLLGYNWAENCEHLSYGMVNLPEGKMKSREGKVVEADELMDETIELAKKEILERHKKIPKKELQKRAELIGLGAIKFQLLKVDPFKDIQFNPMESVSFDGETAPHVQYSFARAASILRKSKKKQKKPDFSALNHETEKRLLSLMVRYPKEVEESLSSRSLHRLVHFSLELASAFNAFYRDVPVLNAEEEAARARIELVKAFKTVMGNCLGLLNIGAPERM